ncbi:hypothetical protein ACFO1V_10125 [Daeguia caeni]|uniref:Uncharacterized protein n=1 Tax=Daeguia caeni TaxID=439612 RepID=A0ABV9H6S6_9HYPH
MGDIRSLIREILAEEIASIRAELLGGPTVEHVSVGTETELTDFALSVLRRAEDPAFVAAMKAGCIRFRPEASSHILSAAPIVVQAAAEPVSRVSPRSEPLPFVSTVPPSVPELRKGLITERDIAAIEEGTTRLRITKQARVTPLAGDEARRRGIRIERTLA